MLAEHLVASISTPLKSTAAGSKDVGIFLYELQPLAGLRQSFKKSATAACSLAVSDTHVFAAQTEKAVIHIYNRGKGNHEATIPFNEKITSLALAAGDAVLVLGTQSGRVMAWEIATGRLSSTTQTHLQAVTALAVDPTSNFLLSGSSDASVLVWSLHGILSFSSNDVGGRDESRSPIHSLSSHRSSINSIVIGHGHGQANIAITAGEDSNAMVWDYKTGTLLRTYLLRAIPKTILLDTADRGFYTAYADGSVQLIDFHSHHVVVNELYDNDAMQRPIQPGDEHLLIAEGQELGGAESLALSWDGSRLFSGHSGGKIASWDVSKGSFISLLVTLPGAVNNLLSLPPDGISSCGRQAIQINEVVKPRIASSEESVGVPGDYSYTVQIKQIPEAHQSSTFHRRRNKTLSDFQRALTLPTIPIPLLHQGLADLRDFGKAPANTTNGGLDDDFMELEDESSKQLATLKAQNEELLSQRAHLQRLQKASFAQLREKTQIIDSLVLERRQLAEIAQREHGWEICDPGVEWARFQRRQQVGVAERGQLDPEAGKRLGSDSLTGSESSIDEDDARLQLAKEDKERTMEG